MKESQHTALVNWKKKSYLSPAKKLPSHHQTWLHTFPSAWSRLNHQTGCIQPASAEVTNGPESQTDSRRLPANKRPMLLVCVAYWYHKKPTRFCWSLNSNLKFQFHIQHIFRAWESLLHLIPWKETYKNCCAKLAQEHVEQKHFEMKSNESDWKRHSGWIMINHQPEWIYVIFEWSLAFYHSNRTRRLWSHIAMVKLDESRCLVSSLDRCILSVQVYVMTKIPHIPKAWAHSAWYQNRWTKGIYTFSG